RRAPRERPASRRYSRDRWAGSCRRIIPPGPGGEPMRVHDGRIVKLDVEEVHLPNGNVVTLEIVRHRGAAAAVPVDDGGGVVLIRQYRHATKGYLLEVPAGTLDPGEAPEACALREVEEETGLRAAQLDPLGFIWTTPGFTDERIWLYRATGLTATAVAHES